MLADFGKIWSTKARGRQMDDTVPFQKLVRARGLEPFFVGLSVMLMVALLCAAAHNNRQHKSDKIKR
jgi:hypothetical protein